MPDAALRNPGCSDQIEGMDLNNTTSAMPSSAASKLILVVDDDSFSQELFIEMLLALGVTDTHTADTGRKALRALETLPRQPD